MKIYLCSVGFLLILVSVECASPEEMKQQYVECAKETGINYEEPFKTPSIDEPKGRCFHACTMRKGGTMIDGKARADKAIEIMEKDSPNGVKDSVKAIFNECADTANKGNDECEIVGILHKCIKEKMHPKQ